MDTSKNKFDINDLKRLMVRLRDKEHGCPWDIEQTFETIKPHTIEEAYEVADAIDRGDLNDLKGELGDLLFQVVYHAQMAAEKGAFTMDDVVDHVTRKMISRHPHVFGDRKTAANADAVVDLWEDRKAQERGEQESILDGIAGALPALVRAQKLQNRAARVGFEWDEASEVLDKMDEEIAEMREAIKLGRIDEIKDELGDLFFVLTNFGRMLGLDCEDAVRQTNDKFYRRFRVIERELKAANVSFDEATLDQMEAFWQLAKKEEKCA